MKKQYFYDYHQTLPSSTSGQIDVTPQTPEEKTQRHDRQQTPQEPPAPYQIPATPPPPVTPPRVPVSRSNFLPVVFTVILILIAATLVYSRLPKNYQQCVKWPGSRVSATLPANCTTFWGAQFTQTPGDIELPEGTRPLPTQTPDTDNGAPDAAPTPVDTGDTLGTDTKGFQASPTPEPTSITTKGGLSTQDQSPQSTPQPVQFSGEDASTLVKHRYPEQHLLIKLPQNYSSTHVTRNRDTGLQTFSVSRNGTQVMDVTIQNNWNNTGNARGQSLSFLLPQDTGVIKIDQAQETTYYFEYAGLVHIIRCSHLGNTAVKNTCDAAVNSIQFI